MGGPFKVADDHAVDALVGSPSVPEGSLCQLMINTSVSEKLGKESQ